MATAIPETHKAIVYDKPGELSVKVDQLKTPEPGPGEVLIQLLVIAAAVCSFSNLTDSVVLIQAYAIPT